MAEQAVVHPAALGPLPRRWPVAAACASVALAVALTGVLAVRDRMNAQAASPSAANTQRDAIAVASLQHVAAALATAQGLQAYGVHGLGEIRLGGFRRDVVGALGGTLVASRHRWTLALGGGWACLRFPGRPGGAHFAVVSRGVCPNVPIQTTPSVSMDALRLALAREAARQRAAETAAAAAIASSRTTQVASDARRRFSMSVLEATFGQLAGTGIRAAITVQGVTVSVRGSTACLIPSATADTVMVAMGPCAP